MEILRNPDEGNLPSKTDGCTNSSINRSQQNDLTEKHALTDLEKIEYSAIASFKQKSLELLYDYTKFHIGVYLSVAGVYVTAAFASIGGEPILLLNLYFLGLAVFCTMIAGFAGGVIVSSLTQWHSGSSKDFLESFIGPWNWIRARRKARWWTYVEHTSFWIGLLSAGLSFSPYFWWHAIGMSWLTNGYR